MFPCCMDCSLMRRRRRVRNMDGRTDYSSSDSVPYEDDELVAEMTEAEQEAAGWLQPAIHRFACPKCNMEKEEPEDSCWCVCVRCDGGMCVNVSFVFVFSCSFELL